MEHVPQYVIRFTGKVSWDGQANGLPPEIFGFIIFEGDDSKAINALIESQAANFIRNQCMLVQSDQGKIIDMRQTPADRMMVPMRWIVSITVGVHLLVGELSQRDAEGIERFKDGTEPVKQ